MLSSRCQSCESPWKFAKLWTLYVWNLTRSCKVCHLTWILDAITLNVAKHMLLQVLKTKKSNDTKDILQSCKTAERRVFTCEDWCRHSRKRAPGRSYRCPSLLERPLLIVVTSRLVFPDCIPNIFKRVVRKTKTRKQNEKQRSRKRRPPKGPAARDPRVRYAKRTGFLAFDTDWFPELQWQLRRRVKYWIEW